VNQPKPLRFTRHALDALTERELQADWVEATVRAPDWREPDPHDPAVIRCFRVIPERGGRILRVALVETEAEIRILSAFLDRRARRPA
jgi:hypothetical protein